MNETNFRAKVIRAAAVGVASMASNVIPSAITAIKFCLIFLIELNLLTESFHYRSTDCCDVPSPLVNLVVLKSIFYILYHLNFR